MSSAVAAVRAVETLLRELEAADMFSGVVGVEQGDEELLHEAYGYASRTWGIPTTVETRFDTASITKLFTAVATAAHRARRVHAGHVDDRIPRARGDRNLARGYALPPADPHIGHR